MLITVDVTKCVIKFTDNFIIITEEIFALGYEKLSVYPFHILGRVFRQYYIGHTIIMLGAFPSIFAIRAVTYTEALRRLGVQLDVMINVPV